MSSNWIMFYALLAVSAVTVITAVTFAKYHQKRWYCWTLIAIGAIFVGCGFYTHNYFGLFFAILTILGVLPHTLSLYRKPPEQ